MPVLELKPVKIVNTLPHPVRIKVRAGGEGEAQVVEYPPTEDSYALFRGKSSRERVGHVVLSEPGATPELTAPVSGRQRFDMDWAAYDAYMANVLKDGPVVFLVSTISGDILYENREKARRPGAWFLVPYTGPDRELCQRNERGEIDWCAELTGFMDI